jgi:diaminopimelate decarboxylase
MDFFEYRNGRLYAEDVPVERIADDVGTPCHIYSEATLKRHFNLLKEAFAEADPLICYSVKANSSLAVLKLLDEEGSGFDIVSGGELFRVLKIGGDPARVVYAGVGKTRREIEYAIEAGILMFNVESKSELEAIEAVAGSLAATAAVALRLNPDVDPKTHRHTTTGKKENKFGIDLETADAIISDLHALPHVKLTGLDTHLGSPINTVDPYVQALTKVLPLLESARAAGHQVEYINIGGGYGIEYRGGETATPADYAAAIVPLIKKSGCKLIMEPGRFIVGNAGIMLSRVTYVKESGDRSFAICDAAMNDLIRPALYDSYHKIWPVTTDKALSESVDARADRNGYANFDVVGPVCESGDFLAKGRTLPRMAEGDLLSIFSAGAYGMSMSSNYNSRPRAAEVMVSGAGYRIVRQRETYDDLIRAERFD